MFETDKVAAVYSSDYRGVNNSDVEGVGLKKSIAINDNAVPAQAFQLPRSHLGTRLRLQSQC